MKEGGWSWAFLQEAGEGCTDHWLGLQLGLVDTRGALNMVPGRQGRKVIVAEGETGLGQGQLSWNIYFLGFLMSAGLREKKMDMEENKAREEDKMEGNKANHPEL